MALFNSMFSYKIHVVKVGYGQVLRHEGRLGIVLVLGLSV